LTCSKEHKLSWNKLFSSAIKKKDWKNISGKKWWGWNLLKQWCNRCISSHELEIARFKKKFEFCLIVGCFTIKMDTFTQKLLAFYKLVTNKRCWWNLIFSTMSVMIEMQSNIDVTAWWSTTHIYTSSILFSFVVFSFVVRYTNKMMEWFALLWKGLIHERIWESKAWEWVLEEWREWYRVLYLLTHQHVHWNAAFNETSFDFKKKPTLHY
jgi:hypothetical protein